MPSEKFWDLIEVLGRSRYIGGVLGNMVGTVSLFQDLTVNLFV
jgi:hypothetical protein